jgi:hypothetical protein
VHRLQTELWLVRSALIATSSAMASLPSLDGTVADGGEQPPLARKLTRQALRALQTLSEGVSDADAVGIMPPPPLRLHWTASSCVTDHSG